MKLIQTIILVLAVASSATTAWAQFGLYGSPEMLNLAPPNPALVPYGREATPAAYPQGAAAPAMHAVRAVTAGRPLQPYPRSFFQAAGAGPPAGTPGQGVSPSPSDAPPQGPSVVDQMLSEAGNCSDAGCRGEAAANGWAGGYYSPWYASVYALVMGRNKANNLWTSYEVGNLANNPYPPYEWGWRWGGEIRFGRRFCSGCSSGCGDCSDYGSCVGQGGFPGAWAAGGWALEATYWTLEEFSSLGIVNQFGAVSTTLDLQNVSFGGSPAQNWFDNAEEHRVQRRSEVHNVELALVRNSFTDYYGSPWELDWSVAVRYFRFEDGLVFSSLRGSGSWSNPSDVAYLEDQITNSLIGFQLGIDAGYYIRPRWRVFLTPEFGIYNNHIVNDFRLHLGDGTVATQSAYPGLTYPVHSTDDVLSFLTQVDLGLEWQFAQRWGARIGYRVVVATGIGLADHQIPHYVTDIPEIASIDHNAELILHGAFVGLTYNF